MLKIQDLTTIFLCLAVIFAAARIGNSIERVIDDTKVEYSHEFGPGHYRDLPERSDRTSRGIVS